MFAVIPGMTIPGMTFRRILVPVDEGGRSLDAVQTALALGRPSGAEVTLLHLTGPTGIAIMAPEPMYLAPQLLSGANARRRAQVEERYEALMESAPGVDVDLVTASGPPEIGIPAFAHKWDADLIVIGSHGSAGLERWVFGSVAESIAPQVDCPTLVLLGEEAPELPFSRAVVGVDYSEGSVRTALAADAMISEYGVVDLVHVYREEFTSSGNLDGSPIAEPLMVRGDAEQQRLLEFAETLPPGRRRQAHAAAASDPVNGLLEHAAETGADLAVLGIHDRSFLERLVGTVSDRVLHRRELPLLLVPGAAPADAPRRDGDSVYIEDRQ